MRRWRNGECTRCGRALDPGPITSDRFTVAYDGEEVWCRRCAAGARKRPKPRSLTADEWAAYMQAIIDEYG